MFMGTGLEGGGQQDGLSPYPLAPDRAREVEQLTLCCLLETVFPKFIQSTGTLPGHGRHAWEPWPEPPVAPKVQSSCAKAGGSSDEDDSQNTLMTRSLTQS